MAEARQCSDPLLPAAGSVVDIKVETASGDVKTFLVELNDDPGLERFQWGPGQCAILVMPGKGEAIFSISDSHTRGKLSFSIKEIGLVTSALHSIRTGFAVGVRGPLGNGFPVGDWKGKDLLIIGGGIGLAPLRPIIHHVIDNRGDYGHVDIVYGARSPGDLVFREDLFDNWPKVDNLDVHVTVDGAPDGDWDGPVGFVPAFLEQLAPSAAGKIAVTCGPPIMIKFVLESMERLGFDPQQVFTTLELKMQCGVGKCGRCNIGSKYVCVDGPVFTWDDMNQMPPEF